MKKALLVIGIGMGLIIGGQYMANITLKEEKAAYKEELNTACRLVGDMNGDKDLTIVDLSILAEHIRSVNQQKQSI